MRVITKVEYTDVDMDVYEMVRVNKVPFPLEVNDSEGSIPRCASSDVLRETVHGHRFVRYVDHIRDGEAIRETKCDLVIGATEGVDKVLGVYLEGVGDAIIQRDALECHNRRLCQELEDAKDQRDSLKDLPFWCRVKFLFLGREMFK